MSDEHEPARRSARRDQLQALADRGATEGERAAAAKALADYDAKHPEPAERAHTWTATITPVNTNEWNVTVARCGSADELLRQRARTILDDLDGVHDAEVHAGKLGTMVVWRESELAADRLAKLKGATLRMPNGDTKIARSSSGTIHDTDQDRWGVLYRARDLKRG
jgi:hypothetical protein